MKYNFVNWTDERTQVLVNPRLTKLEKKIIETHTPKMPEFKGHIWVMSSGSTSVLNQLKMVALSKNAFLTSATAVNNLLDATQKDIWFNVLPLFHVGGLGVLARGFLSQSQVINLEDARWNPNQFVDVSNIHKVTLSALVPTQVYDLVARKLPAPPTMRAVIVGGGALSEALYEQARQLGWPLLPSYGLTECCSQVATAGLQTLQQSPPKLPHGTPLSHVEVKTDSHSRLMIKSKALLTGWAILSEEKMHYEDPKKDGWFTTEDQVQIENNTIRFMGRLSNIKKVSGELVDVNRLQDALVDLIARNFSKINAKGMALLATPNPRLGYQIDLVAELGALGEAPAIRKEFNHRVKPFERIHNIYYVHELARTALDKIQTSRINALLGFDPTMERVL